MSELKPCPFCGSGEVFYKHALSCEVECDNCGASMHSGDWNTRPVEDELRAELARRNEERNSLADENRMLSERIQRLVEGVKSRDKIISRLKEDGESLASIAIGGVSQIAEDYWECPYCMDMAYDVADIHHAPDCPITLHRALMKEIER